jgi:Na+/H+-translocating membrane pyrophosphatase
VLSVSPKKKLNESKSGDDEKEVLVNSKQAEPELSQEQVDKLEMISKKISDGANVFLWSEYFYLLIFIVLFSALIHYVAEEKPGQWYTTIAFAVGALTSIICGYIGMMIATSANYRTAYKA